MIPMNCPQCGSQGEIPLDKLDTRLHCRKCGAFFYVEKNGQVHLGDPPDSASTESILKPQKRRRERAEVDLNPFSGVQGPSRRTWAGLGIALGVGLFIAGAVSVVKAVNKPEDINAKALKLAHYFVDLKLEDLKQFGAQDAKGLTEWYNVVRAQLPLMKPRESKSDATISNIVIGESDKAAETLTSITLNPALLRDTTKTLGVSYSLIWIREDGQWQVDYLASLKQYRDNKARVERAEVLQRLRSGSRGGSSK